MVRVDTSGGLFEAGGERTCQIIAERIRALLSAASPGQPEETKHGG